VFADIHDEGKRQIDDYRRSERDKRRINEEQSNTRRCHSEFFSQPGTHAKGILLKKMLDFKRNPIHKLSIFNFQLLLGSFNDQKSGSQI
jgi:hypothetical protein